MMLSMLCPQASSSPLRIARSIADCILRFPSAVRSASVGVVTSVETRALAFDKAYYDLEVSPGGGDLNTAADVIRILEGRIIFSKEVTR